MLRSRILPALVVAACSASAKGQTIVFPPGVVFPPGAYQVITTGATTIEQGVKDGRQYVTLSWIPGTTPAPPAPIPPTPDPTPAPPPIPAFGPLERIVILYESAALTGREPMYSRVVQDALNQACPPDPNTKIPMWRCWDKDLDPSGEPAWMPAVARAKADYAGGSDPKLYAFDATGRVKILPLKDAKDAAVADWIKSLVAPAEPARKAA